MIGRLIAATSPGRPSEMYGSFWSPSGWSLTHRMIPRASTSSRLGALRSVAVWVGSMSGSAGAGARVELVVDRVPGAPARDQDLVDGEVRAGADRDVRLLDGLRHIDVGVEVDSVVQPPHAGPEATRLERVGVQAEHRRVARDRRVAELQVLCRRAAGADAERRDGRARREREPRRRGALLSMEHTLPHCGACRHAGHAVLSVRWGVSRDAGEKARRRAAGYTASASGGRGSAAVSRRRARRS